MAVMNGGVVVVDVDGDELRFCPVGEGLMVRDEDSEPLLFLTREDATCLAESLLEWAKGE